MLKIFKEKDIKIGQVVINKHPNSGWYNAKGKIVSIFIEDGTEKIHWDREYFSYRVGGNSTDYIYYFSQIIDFNFFTYEDENRVCKNAGKK